MKKRTTSLLLVSLLALAGCSTGAMILGARTLGFTSLGSGFGLLPETVILPHFDEFGGWMLRLARLRARGYRLVGIDGNTALVIDGVEQRVVGSGAVTVLEEGAERRFQGGDVLPD
jgi:cyanophycinase-like exopeptidase